ncbi:MAG: DNA repair protein RecN [Mycobacteriales bacterium]|nr:DNA repair protein RecN [Frankia sp.]
MLRELRITGLGAIAEAAVEFDAGLTVVTGETGAGKTMVVHGLSLLFGGRLDSGLVRQGGRAVVEGTVELSATSASAQRAAELGADLEGDSLLLARTMSADGRSRCQLGGRSVPVATLGEMADDLLALHGQSDQLRLLRPGAQRELLDRYAGESGQQLVGKYRAAHAEWHALGTELAELRDHRASREREREDLTAALREIETLGPEAGEDRGLDEEIERLAHVDALRTAAAAARAALLGDDDGEMRWNAQGLLADARGALAAVGLHDATLGDLSARLTEASYQVGEVAHELSSYLAALEADPARLAAAQERRAALAAAMRRHGLDLAAILAWATRAAERVTELGDDATRLTQLTGEYDASEARLATLAAELSRLRSATAAALSAAVSAELAELAMPDAVFTVEVRQHDAGDGGLLVGDRLLAVDATGVDHVEMLLAAHKSVVPRPLHRGASGGELSRTMLALEVVLADADPVPTMVFDEVDAGVGGRAAVELGRRLARLARSHQVIAVSHLPQVAAFADRHVVVEKSAGGSVSAAGVNAVEGEARLRELSRMLAGIDGSALARGHAEELLAAAAGEKQ